jgi:hypothetical protein
MKGTMTITKSIGVFAGAIALLAIAGTAHADISFITDKSSVAWGDYVDWGAVATAGSATTPYAAVSNNGLSATVSDTNGFYGAVQPYSWDGNFSLGDNVLYTLHASDPIIVKFATPVFGGGAQIESTLRGDFIGTVSAYDSDNSLLGTFSLPGASVSSQDGTAIFIGIGSTDQDISELQFSSTNDLAGFGINRLQLATVAVIPQAVPEPGSLLALAMGVGSMGAFLRKRN